METAELGTHTWQVKGSLIGGVLAFGLLVLGIIYCAANGYGLGVGSLSVVAAFGVVSRIIELPSSGKKRDKPADRT
jgi:energy-converting hydrogenase Eha subunit B